MKPYGIPRDPELDFPDVGTITKYALKSAIGKPRGISGDFKGYLKGGSNRKQRVRRIWKKMERSRIKRQMAAEISDGSVEEAGQKENMGLISRRTWYDRKS